MSTTFPLLKSVHYILQDTVLTGKAVFPATMEGAHNLSLEELKQIDHLTFGSRQGDNLTADVYLRVVAVASVQVLIVWV